MRLHISGATVPELSAGFASVAAEGTPLLLKLNYFSFPENKENKLC